MTSIGSQVGLQAMPMDDRQPQLWRRMPYGIVPASGAAEDAISRVPQGAIVETRIKQPRNVAHHRKYWTLVHVVARALDIDDQVAHRVLKVLAGYLREVTLPDGRTVQVEASTSFAAMSEDEFARYYDSAVNAAIRAVGCTSEELEREIAIAY